mmetsp:Transcript_88069/g.179922  ORF Transcript_88069/g.179922 Transcript_88069/m.179922 type:complete len:259 (-) Transcript_88069:2420-3196(-)
MISASARSQAMEMAGTISVPKSMHRINTVLRGSGVRTVMKHRKGAISGMLEDRVYAMDFFKLSKIRRPSSTPRTMEAKLSSSRIMSAASRATLVPTMPMATPISAFFRAGASLTPSPVTATISFSSFWNLLTISSFWMGDVRANTISSWARMKRHFSSVVSAEIWWPATTMAGARVGSRHAGMAPTSCWMASAEGEAPPIWFAFLMAAASHFGRSFSDREMSGTQPFSAARVVRAAVSAVFASAALSARRAAGAAPAV